MMPMFYFQQQAGNDVAEDPEGSELPDLITAREYAVASARELLANAIKFNTPAPDRIFIEGEDGTELLTVFITEVLPASLRKKFR
jgi:uncharacterized protein DUF6894